MPSAEDYVPDFDALDEQSLPPSRVAAPQAAVEADPWGFNEQPSPKREIPKKKKKTKKDVAAKKNRLDDGEDSSAYPKSITPSPPTVEQGVKLQTASPPIVHSRPITASSPLAHADDDSTAVEDVEPFPKARLSSNLPQSILPAVTSPRPTPARPVSTAVSPPSRPLSLHGVSFRDRNNSLSAGYAAASAQYTQPDQPRRGSFASPRPRFVDPPPPHMPQAHFFTLPDLGFGFNQKQETGEPAGSNGYCCRFDTFADSADEPSAKKARDALLVGCEGGLEVFRILPNKLEVVGRLEGLRGSVVGAKVIPHTKTLDVLQIFRPLVAVILHGPMKSDHESSGADRDDENKLPDVEGHFQTTVEVYSLQTQHYIATLYAGIPVATWRPVVGQVSSLPEPVGDLQVDAKGEFITISSGKSGEIFVFTQASYAGNENTRFRCLGKFWTSVQKSLAPGTSQPPAAGTAAANVNAGEAKEERRTALYSLSQRWLTIVPPFSSDISIQGVPTLSDVNPSPPGITTHAAPPQPIISCEVVGTDVEGTWSRLGRQAAQSLVKYSQRGIEMGLQGWKELTQPSPPGTHQIHDRSSSKESLFPPTKAPSGDPGRLPSEPALVSIVDLESLLNWEEQKPKYAPVPMATFALVDGCNFVSLSATGTKLLTASRKGEASIIWDLTQVTHGTPKRNFEVEDDHSTSPCIKQIQRIARNSPSVILDCAWSRDDDALALLTAHGTVHLHEVRTRMPLRRRKPTKKSVEPMPEKADATVSLSSGMSPPSVNQGFLGSIKSSWHTVSTQVNSIRSTNPASAFGLPTTFAGFREATAASGNAASRAVARGLSQGYTAAKGGASDYWHADDNKVRHTKALQEPFSDKSLRWMKRNNTVSIAIACGGTVHTHPVQRVSRLKGDVVVSGLKHERYAHKAFPLPTISTRSETGTLPVKSDICMNQGPHGFWSLRHSTTPPPSERKLNWQTVQQVQGQPSDVETNPPYCPFHVDSRVNILAFEENESGSQYGISFACDEFQMKGHGLDHEDAWAFGEALPSSNKINESISDELLDEPLIAENDDNDNGDDDDDEEDVASQMESKLTIQPARKNRGGEQIMINTRRRKGKAKGAGLGEFDLLEDDDGDDLI